MPDNEVIDKLKESIIEGETDAAIEFTKKAVELGINVKQILDEGLIAATQIVGELFEKMEYYLPDLIISADAMIGAMNVIRPRLKDLGSQQYKATILIGSVEGDVHSIGKNLMIALLEGQGYDVIDLGTDVPPEKFIEIAKKENPAVIGMSGLLTTSISAMQKTVLMLKEEKIQSKIIVGGGILSNESFQMIGADEYATDGWEGLNKIKKLMEVI